MLTRFFFNADHTNEIIRQFDVVLPLEVSNALGDVTKSGHDVHAHVPGSEQVVPSLLPLPTLHKEVAAIGKGSLVRSQIQRLAVVLQSAPVVALSPVGNAAIVMNTDILRIQGQRLVEVLDGKG